MDDKLMQLDKRQMRTFVIALLALAFLALAPEGVGAAEAEDWLEKARLAYASGGAFTETLELELQMPDGTTSARRQIYGVGEGGGAFFHLFSEGREAFRIVAIDGKAVVLQGHIGGRYGETTFAGGFAEALVALEAQQAQLAAPPAVVAAQGGDEREFLDALRYAILAPLEPVGTREATGANGQILVEVDLAAANGKAVVGLDAASGRLSTLNVTLGEGPEQIRAVGRFEFTSGEPAVELVWPDVQGRTSVATLPALSASEYPLGEVVASLVVPSLDGEDIDLAALTGQVVVLDFWATWCVPCWEALEHTEELTRWAKESGKPVRVFAVDSLERAENLEAQRDQARRFLASRDLDLEVLVDHGNAAFAAFHNPGLPSLVIIDQEGRLADYHSGVVADMVRTVRERVLELLDAAE